MSISIYTQGPLQPRAEREAVQETGSPRPPPACGGRCPPASAGGGLAIYFLRVQFHLAPRRAAGTAPTALHGTELQGSGWVVCVCVLPRPPPPPPSPPPHIPEPPSHLCVIF